MEALDGIDCLLLMVWSVLCKLSFQGIGVVLISTFLVANSELPLKLDWWNSRNRIYHCIIILLHYTT